MVKEIDMQEQEAQRVPNMMDAKRSTPRHTTIKMAKVKDKERILKAAREVSYLQGRVPVRLSAVSQKKLCRLEGIGKKYSKS